MKLTVRADAFVDFKEVLRPSKLVIEEGKIKGSVKPDEEVEEVELELGGRGRISTPAFVSLHTYMSLYPFRFGIFSGHRNATDLLSVMTENDAYHFALLSAYHLAKSGVSAVAFSEPFGDTVARAVTEVGLRPYIIVGAGCWESKSDWKSEFKVLFQRWSSYGRKDVMVKVCETEELDEAVGVAKEAGTTVILDRTVPIHIVEKKGLIGEVPLLALGGGARSDIDLVKKYKIPLAFTPTYEISKFPLSEYDPALTLDLSPRYDIFHELSIATSRLILKPDEALKAGTFRGFQLLGLEAGVFEIGKEADLVVFEFREPPNFPFDNLVPYETVIFGSHSVETLVVKGEPVVDGGVPINVGLSHVEKALEKVREVDERASKAIRNLATSGDPK